METPAAIHIFGAGIGGNDRPSREEVGSKAFNLIRMARIGLPVPPGFVIGTRFCREYLDGGKVFPAQILRMVEDGIKKLEAATRLNFGGQRRPLLVSVRSGAAVSMPGMMDTLLNVGINDLTVSSLVRMTGNPRFAWDSYRRLVQAYAEVAHDCQSGSFEDTLGEFMRADGSAGESELDSQVLAKLARLYLETFEEQTGTPFPQQPMRQLTGAIEAVFKSWESERAKEYRRIHDIHGLAGTAVTVQAMVFGNMGATSGSGVAFTRDPVTGEAGLYMDFLFNAQGEDVVSGRQQTNHSARLAQLMPGVFKEIQSVGRRLELEFRDMQDFEFTVQEGRLYVLQCRSGKRTPWAALRISVDLVNEGIIDKETARRWLEGYDLTSITHTKLAAANAQPLAQGLAANRRVATGEITFDSETVQEMAKAGRTAILVRDDTSTSDIAGMVASAGILTRLGGRTSHAAVVARQMDKVCIVNCSTLSIDLKARKCVLGGEVFCEGDLLSLDGNTGKIYAGALDVVVERPVSLLAEVEKWK